MMHGPPAPVKTLSCEVIETHPLPAHQPLCLYPRPDKSPRLTLTAISGPVFRLWDDFQVGVVSEGRDASKCPASAVGKFELAYSSFENLVSKD